MLNVFIKYLMFVDQLKLFIVPLWESIIILYQNAI